MKTIDLAIDYRALMSDEERKTIGDKDAMLERVKSIVEVSILSSLADAQVDGKRLILGKTQRGVDHILDAIDESKTGKIMLTDEDMISLAEMWEKRLSVPLSGKNRKLIQMIDRRICPWAYGPNGEKEKES